MVGAAAADGFPLFDAHPALRDRAPRLPLGNWPTPVIEAKTFAARHGIGSLHLKREDLSHPDCGGNKVRGLEFLLADALARGATRIVTFSSTGSHHVSRTAWHARRLGIETSAVVVPQPDTAYLSANCMMGRSAGARYVEAGFVTVLPKLFFEFVRPSNRRAGGRPYFISAGGTNALACLGHVNAAFELRRQVSAGELPPPDFIYVPLGSLGTAAGLIVGCRLAGLSARIVGVVVSYRFYCTPGRIARLARRTLALMRRLDPAVPRIELARGDFDVVAGALGPGYAKPTSQAKAIADQMLSDEGVALDETYMSKTVHGMLLAMDSRGTRGRRHLVWHTYQRPVDRSGVPSEPDG